MSIIVHRKTYADLNFMLLTDGYVIALRIMNASVMSSTKICASQEASSQPSESDEGAP